jgi:hypothetical protein
MNIIDNYQLKKPDIQPANQILNKPDEEDSDEENKKKHLICRVCDHKITAIDQKIPINGSSEYSFTNPAGFKYNIGCFKSAPGCIITGIPTAEYTWFSGYSWRFAMCGNCNYHLGWFYESSGYDFYGLIPDKLIEKE